MKVAIIGGGPSGMFAAWAAIQYGHDITVFDRDPAKISSGNNHGVFALWDNCDLFLSQKQMVRVGIMGGKGKYADQIEELYSTKVYGDPSVESSISKYCKSEIIECYNHAEAYAQILDFVGKERIYKSEIFTPEAIIHKLGEYDIVINTLPANSLWPEYEWPSKTAFIYHGKSPEQDAFMIYNVNQYIPWYRCSAIFGYFSMEYTDLPVNDKHYIKVTKVMPGENSPSNYMPNKVWNVGRFGNWDKETLTEDVYYSVLTKFNQLEHPPMRTLYARV